MQPRRCPPLRLRQTSASPQRGYPPQRRRKQRATARPPPPHAPAPLATAQSAQARARPRAQQRSVRVHRALAARFADNSRSHCPLRAAASPPVQPERQPASHAARRGAPLGARRLPPPSDMPASRDRCARRRCLPRHTPRRANSGSEGCSPQPVAPTLVSFRAGAAGRGRARMPARAQWL